MELLNDPEFIKLLNLCTQQMRDQIAYLNAMISQYEYRCDTQAEINEILKRLWLHERMSNLISEHSLLLTDALRDKNYPITVVYCPN